MKIFILHSRLSGYMAACWRELAQAHNVDIVACIWPNQHDAPFDESGFTGIGQLLDRREETSETLLAKINEFKPDAILTSGWIDKDYVKVCKAIKGTGIPIIAGSDTQWKGSLRQKIASFISPLHVQQIFDAIWVSGERQRQFAKNLGFEGHKCWDGYYACDYNNFVTAGNAVNFEERSGFITVGRLVPVKGLDTLAKAYSIYRERVSEPWGLNVIGAGPESAPLEAAGANMVGFIQPSELPAMMAKSKCFILPSRFEPWGVVVQEAACTGLPLIISDKCGASVHLLRDRWNGRSFHSESVDELVESMIWIHEQTEERHKELGANSKKLGEQYTPSRWSQSLIEGIGSLLAHAGIE
ncbi:glycosyltransferase family 4 protein [Vibrio sp. 10N.261.51.C6]|uniref:glycosyltransferase family 4 protein n=1 Tax=Vibrio sp. 10N.261.51.C6 TaxID=3229676 RepID=UPI00354B284C